MFDKHDVTTKKLDVIVEKVGKVDANYAAQIEGYCSLLGEYGKKFETVCAMLALDLIGVIPVIGALKYSDEIGTLFKNADKVSVVARSTDGTGVLAKHADEAGTWLHGVKVFRYSDETAEAVTSGEKLLTESGTIYESFADMMSPEDAKRYLDFLENGSREGLTSAELADALLVSQKVGYEDVWDLRNVGDALESGINSYADFSKAISDIGMRSDLTDAQKISELQKLFESSNYKADINVPSDIQYVKGFDAKGNVIYDWPPKLGFDESTIKSISRTDSLPDTWDRYGYMGGSNFADVPPTGKYTYSERAIPYVENEAAYHTGAFNNATYFDKIDAIKNGDIDGLNTILSREGIANVDSSYFKNLQNTYNDFIEDTANAVGSNIDATYGLKGTAASWGDMSGGAGQYVTPLNGSTMKRLGIIN